MRKDLKQKTERFETNNKIIALNVLFKSNNSDGVEQIKEAYIAKHSSKHKNKVNLLMITDNGKWHYLAMKRLSRLLRGITSNHNDDQLFYELSPFIQNRKQIEIT